MVTLIAAVLSLGCSDAASERNSNLDRQPPIDSDGQQVIGIGDMRLDFSPPVELDNAKLTLVRIGDGRPSAVQIANYDISIVDHEYPAVLFHGTTEATHSRLLAGQTIECVMFFQDSEYSMIATTKPGEPVRLTFRTLNETGTAVSVALEPVELISADNQVISFAGGQIAAITYDANP